jgi:hypothetical protein
MAVACAAKINGLEAQTLCVPSPCEGLAARFCELAGYGKARFLVSF